MGITYHIADRYKEIKEQAGIQDERAAAFLAAAYEIAIMLESGFGANIPGALMTLADEVSQLKK